MESDVEKVKARVSIVDVVGQYVPLKRAGKNFSARCPFHKERTPSFHVSPERGTYMCFGCGEKGDIFSFVQKIDGIDFPTALKQLAEKAGIKLERRFSKAPDQKQKEERLRDVCEAAVVFFESELKRRKDVKEYIRTRGVKDEIVLSWRLGYAPSTWESLCVNLKTLGFTHEEIVEAGFGVKSEKRPGEIFDRFRGRIIFPIFDVTGVPVAVSGRFFEDVPGRKQEGEPAKYVNSPETLLFKKSRVLYGYDRARAAIRKADCILLVEGQFDLILAHQSGLPFTVALSGTALTLEHLSLLGRLSKRLVLALDADQAGIRAGLSSTKLAFASGFDVKIPAFPAGKDPADMARENPELLKAAIRTSKTAIEFFLNALQFSVRDERGYKKTVEMQLLPLVAALPSKIDQEHFMALIAHALGVSLDSVREEVRKRGFAPISAQENDVAYSEDALPAFEKKVGMLLFYFGDDTAVRTRLRSIVGEERLKGLEEALTPRAEALRFSFEQELGEHTTAEKIAEDMLGELERQIAREHFKIKFL